MSEYLVPLNYSRAHDVLKRLSVFTEYRPKAAQTALATLRQNYPFVFSRMEEKHFANDAVLLEMNGSGGSAPLVFVSHADAPECDNILDCPADMPLTVPLSRAHLVALLEALEELLRTGYRPSGDLLICLSMDGLSGGAGAKAMAEHLRTRALAPSFLLDYGGYASREAFRTYVSRDAVLALVGVAEKGEILGTVTAVTNDPGSRHRPAEDLLRAGAGLTRVSRLPRLCEAAEKMLKALSRKAPLPQRWLIAAPKVTFPLLCLRWRGRSVLSQFFLSERRVCSFTAEGTALVLPSEASLSFRQTLLPGADPEKLKREIRRCAGLHHAEAAFWTETPATPCSATEGAAWDAFGTAIEIHFDRAQIVPCLAPFPTDCRYYAGLSDHVYRFSPFLVTGRQALKGKCTVSADALQTAVQFFRSMLSV